MFECMLTYIYIYIYTYINDIGRKAIPLVSSHYFEIYVHYITEIRYIFDDYGYQL